MTQLYASRFLITPGYLIPKVYADEKGQLDELLLPLYRCGEGYDLLSMHLTPEDGGRMAKLTPWGTNQWKYRQHTKRGNLFVQLTPGLVVDRFDISTNQEWQIPVEVVSKSQRSIVIDWLEQLKRRKR